MTTTVLQATTTRGRVRRLTVQNGVGATTLPTEAPRAGLTVADGCSTNRSTKRGVAMSISIGVSPFATQGGLSLSRLLLVDTSLSLPSDLAAESTPPCLPAVAVTPPSSRREVTRRDTIGDGRDAVVVAASRAYRLPAISVGGCCKTADDTVIRRILRARLSSSFGVAHTFPSVLYVASSA